MLNPGQGTAVHHGKGPMLVTAGPGSGKTYVLTSRIQYLIESHQIPPEKILVLTFTRDAAVSMKQRFEQMCPIYRNKVSFGTFHSFFYHILRSEDQFKECSVLDPQEKKKILFHLLSDIKQKAYSEDAYGYERATLEECHKVSEAVSAFYNTGNLDSCIEKLPYVYKDNVRQILDAYSQEKKLRNKLDMDDLMLECYRIFHTDRNILQRWQKKYAFYLIDEFQDCNRMQYDIIKQLILPPYNLFTVGDDDQAIYGFRGSDSSIMKKMLEDYPAVRKVELGMNYRCGNSIVEASKKVISCNTNRFKKSLQGFEEKGYVKILEFETKEQEYLYLCQCIQKIPPLKRSNAAILVRTNQSIQMIAGYLKKQNIPVTVKETYMPFSDHFIIKDMISYLMLIEGHRDRELFLKVFMRPRIPVGRECLKSQKVDLQQVINYYEQESDFGAVNAIREFMRKLNQAEKLTFPLRIRYILNGFGYLRFLYQKAGGDETKKEEWMEMLDLLQTISADLHSVEDLLLHLKTDKKKGSIKNSISENNQNGVHLMTLHGAKGLEYDTVYLPDLNEGSLPKHGKGEKISKEKVEEERRLFYVGMTRAREHLEILCVKGNRERPKEPSRFLLPLL